MLNNRPFSLIAVVLAAALFLCAPMDSKAQGEKKISAKELPAAVKSAFQKAYPKAKIKGMSMEVENGKTLFEVESVDGKVNRDLLYNPDGTCAEIEESIPLSALPTDVSMSLKKEFPQGKVLKSEKLMKGETIQYELVIQSGKTKSEVVFDTAGKIVKNEKKAMKNKEEKEE